MSLGPGQVERGRPQGHKVWGAVLLGLGVMLSSSFLPRGGDSWGMSALSQGVRRRLEEGKGVVVCGGDAILHSIQLITYFTQLAEEKLCLGTGGRG